MNYLDCTYLALLSSLSCLSCSSSLFYSASCLSFFISSICFFFSAFCFLMAASNFFFASASAIARSFLPFSLSWSSFSFRALYSLIARFSSDCLFLNCWSFFCCSSCFSASCCCMASYALFLGLGLGGRAVRAEILVGSTVDGAVDIVGLLTWEIMSCKTWPHSITSWDSRSSLWVKRLSQTSFNLGLRTLGIG